MRLAWTACILALAAGALGCKDEPRPAPRTTPAGPQRAPAFTVRDLALATAVDARAAMLSVVGADVEAAMLAAPKERARAKPLLAALEVARAELEQAVQAVANPLDRALAESVAALAKRYAQELSDAAASGAPGAGLLRARSELGDAIAAYRRSRGSWSLDAPETQGPEREFGESRRELERAETGVMSRTQVALRGDEHEQDAAALRMSGHRVALRAKAAAELLPPATRDAARRYAAAQERVLDAAIALSRAGEKDAAQAARAYHAAKADALAALADYFAAVSAR